jgi:glycosyltransferase involved in cell wall biosynthesis
VVSKNGVAISIITVVVNDLPGFRVTSESIMRQSDTNFEWIIIDGQSDDGTEETAKKHGDSPNVKFYSIPRRGIYDAMNYGIRAAKGEWVWFINAGDFFLDENCIAELSGHLSSFSESTLISSPVLQISKSGYLFGVTQPKIEVTSQGRVWNFHHQGTLMPRKVILSLGLFDTSLKLAADSKLIDLLGNVCDCVLLSQALVGFQMGGRATSNYLQTLKEIRKHRPSAQYPTRISSYYIKNVIRSLVLKYEHLHLVGAYLKLRQFRVLGFCANQHIEINHDHGTKFNNCPEFSCCNGTLLS